MADVTFFVLLAFLGISSGNPLPKTGEGKLNNRIVGGLVAQKGQFPYQVSLRVDGEHSCGGSILNQKWILTAKHCVRSESAASLSVVVGITNLYKPEPESSTHAINKVIVHKNSDLALIQLKDSITYSAAVKNISLPLTNMNIHDVPVVASGWGKQQMGGSIQLKLQYLNTKIYDQNFCKKRLAELEGFPLVTDRHICTFTKLGEGLCHGDSGGPIVAGKFQVGIVSFGKPCARGYPDVHVDVWKYVDWINSYINQD